MAPVTSLYHSMTNAVDVQQTAEEWETLVELKHHQANQFSFPLFVTHNTVEPFSLRPSNFWLAFLHQTAKHHGARWSVLGDANRDQWIMPQLPSKNIQLVRICCTVSSSWSQRTHHSGCASPCLICYPTPFCYLSSYPDMAISYCQGRYLNFLQLVYSVSPERKPVLNAQVQRLCSSAFDCYPTNLFQLSHLLCLAPNYVYFLIFQKLKVFIF